MERLYNGPTQQSVCACVYVYMIDFVMMRRDQRQLWADVRVYRSACCWMDHYLVKGKLMLSLPRKQRNSVACVPLAVYRLSSRK